MPTQQKNAVQALTAELRESLRRLPLADPEQILNQTRTLEQRLLEITNSPRDRSADTANDLTGLHALFKQYVEQIARSQARNERALAALGISDPVYGPGRFTANRASPIPVAGTRPTSVTA